MKVLITPRSFPQSGAKAYKLLREQEFEIIENRTGKTLTENQLVELCRDVDGIIVGVDPITERVLRSAGKLKAISKYGAGLDNVDLETARELGIKVDRAAGTNAVSVAELTVGLIFAIARNIPYSASSVKSGGWDRLRGIEITGKTIGIIGLGAIGREVARMAFGIGMNILGYDPYIDTNASFLKDYSVNLTTLERIYREADFITLHLPLTDGTRHMINRDTLAMMKPTAYLINTARGELVDEDALYDALKSGALAGAAQDVFSKEPPEGHKLLELDNFILTSHIGAYTVEANEKMAVKSAENLIRMLKEE